MGDIRIAVAVGSSPGHLAGSSRWRCLGVEGSRDGKRLGLCSRLGRTGVDLSGMMLAFARVLGAVMGWISMWTYGFVVSHLLARADVCWCCGLFLWSDIGEIWM